MRPDMKVGNGSEMGDDYDKRAGQHLPMMQRNGLVGTTGWAAWSQETYSYRNFHQVKKWEYVKQLFAPYVTGELVRYSTHT
jgi:hypothetical protein